MARAPFILAALALCSAAGCAPAPPPPELNGLWSAGAAACDAGVGIRFSANAIEAIYEDERAVLFNKPRYAVESTGDTFRVRIDYALPRPVGGVAVVGAHGVVVLERRADGSLAPAAHNLIDGRTGAARMRLTDDPAVRALTLQPCGRHPWREDLRGLSTT
jgi:hypothetical protein